MGRLTNDQKFEKLYLELAEWMQGNDHDGSLEYAFNNGYDLHAVSIWQNSGASSFQFSCKIDRVHELKEINELCAEADIFECPDCNHHAYYTKGELDSPPQCMCCLKENMFYKK